MANDKKNECQGIPSDKSNETAPITRAEECQFWQLFEKMEAKRMPKDTPPKRSEAKKGRHAKANAARRFAEMSARCSEAKAADLLAHAQELQVELARAENELLNQNSQYNAYYRGHEQQLRELFGEIDQYKRERKAETSLAIADELRVAKGQEPKHEAKQYQAWLVQYGPNLRTSLIESLKLDHRVCVEPTVLGYSKKISKAALFASPIYRFMHLFLVTNGLCQTEIRTETNSGVVTSIEVMVEH